MPDILKELRHLKVKDLAEAFVIFIIAFEDNLASLTGKFEECQYTRYGSGRSYCLAYCSICTAPFCKEFTLISLVLLENTANFSFMVQLHYVLLFFLPFPVKLKYVLQIV